MSNKVHHYRVKISYKGSNYYGWQDLADDGQKPTVQASINLVLRKICKQQDCLVAAASRTDAGVHALGQVAKLSIPLDIHPEKLLMGMNSLLPQDIRIRECDLCKPVFNPNKDSKRKKYCYYFTLDKVSSPVINDIVAQLRFSEDLQSAGKIDLELMSQAAKLFVGVHDFQNFATRDASIGSTVREIFSLELTRPSQFLFGNEVYCFEIEGSGFLRQMIRYLVGTLFEVGRGKVTLADIEEALTCSTDNKLSGRAKAHGLQLVEVYY